MRRNEERKRVPVLGWFVGKLLPQPVGDGRRVIKLMQPLGDSTSGGHRGARVFGSHYGLLMPLPLTVTFPSVTYAENLQSMPAAGRHELVAHDAKTGV